MVNSSEIKVDIVLPVYNEEKIVEKSVKTLVEFLQENLAYQWRIIIADNASTDSTLEKAQKLAEIYPEVTCYHLDQKGSGRAISKCWAETDAQILSYMDIDLSTDLAAFKVLIASTYLTVMI